METPRPGRSYEERLAEWQKKTSIERKPLTNYQRSEFEKDLQRGNVRATLAEDGSVIIEKAYAVLRGG